MLDDDQPSIRPMERLERERLFFKKFEKIDLHFKKLEAMIHKNALQMQKILLQGGRIMQEEKKIEKGLKSIEKEEDKIITLERKRLDEELKTVERREKLIANQVKKLSDEESSIQELMLQRRDEDAWFVLVMHDCPHKHMDKNALLCDKTKKHCSFVNCPRKREVNKYIK
ncbi:TPA: hypothetical protein HA265_04750 [Candidatus Woesearchaeota archaeon]|nr:hypothetical protein [Candidatus Woesearchaeota archaeon]